MMSSSSTNASRSDTCLRRGTSCKVVENPSLLDVMDHLSDKAKDDVRKILSSKHLFYEEMCSYHNGNRLHLPADPALHRSLQLALSMTRRKLCKMILTRKKILMMPKMMLKIMSLCMVKLEVCAPIKGLSKG
ncbi:uncharacterized protein M6B38_412110 [Iris pallida]|uniref:Uncharacterized protein n=1 Tax=Iris pallida TaxID=29817 RepID=A0AAX6FLQ1_IRIPA|nr:uncharacterized protein M6B38_412110 [Iris pallida]